jgi:hypothetical protein
VFINKALHARREKLEKSQNLLVDMRPEFVEALDNCMSFSSKSSHRVIIYRWQRQSYPFTETIF